MEDDEDLEQRFDLQKIKAEKSPYFKKLLQSTRIVTEDSAELEDESALQSLENLVSSAPESANRTSLSYGMSNVLPPGSVSSVTPQPKKSIKHV